MTLRIAWVAPDFPWPLNSGNSVAIFNRIKELSAKGHQIYLFSTTRCVVDDESIDVLKAHCKSVRTYRLGTQELIRNLLFSPLMPFRTARRFSREMKQDICTCLLSRQLDVLLIEHSAMAAYLPANHSAPVKTVILFQSLAHKSFLNEATYYPARFSYKRLASYVESLKTKFFENHIFKSNICDEYWFYSAADMSDVLAEYPHLEHQIRFIPIGVETREDLNSESPPIRNLSPIDKMILLVGSMNNPSNEDAARFFARRILPRIREKVPRAKFCVVGTNALRKLKDIASPHILIIGEVADLRPYLRRCDLYVVPQRGGGGVKTKLVDGLSAKRIVVATPAGVEAMADIKPDFHFLLAGDQEEFSEKSIQALNNPAKFAEIAENGLRYFKGRFSVEVAGEVAESYLLRLTSQRDK